jgi:hypothetical protein
VLGKMEMAREMELEGEGKIRRQKNIDRHGPRPKRMPSFLVGLTFTVMLNTHGPQFVYWG